MLQGPVKKQYFKKYTFWVRKSPRRYLTTFEGFLFMMIGLLVRPAIYCLLLYFRCLFPIFHHLFS